MLLQAPEMNFIVGSDDEVLDDEFELGISPISSLADYANLGDMDILEFDDKGRPHVGTANDRRKFCAISQKLFAELYAQDPVVQFEEPEFPEQGLGAMIRRNMHPEEYEDWVPLIDQFIVEIRTMLQSKPEVSWDLYNKTVEAIEAAQVQADRVGYEIDVESKLIKPLEYHYRKLQAERKRLEAIEKEKERRAWYLAQIKVGTKVAV